MDRLGAAMRELNARLRVEGLTDEEAQQLATRVDGAALRRLEISTWRTDAGSLDILTDIPDRDGTRLRYADLAPRARRFTGHGVTVLVAALADIIGSKTWADRPKDHDALDELRRLAQTTRPSSLIPPPPASVAAR